MFDSIVSAIRALLLALGGVLLAWLWFERHLLALVLTITLPLCAGYVLAGAGKRALPKRPVLAVRLMEFWILSPAIIAAVAGAAVVIIGVELATPEGTPVETKELVSSLSSGLTAFLTTAFIGWAADEADSPVAELVQQAFHAKYQRAGPENRHTGVKYFRAESAGERWVYSDSFGGAEGWGRAARLKRARGVARELDTGSSDG